LFTRRAGLGAAHEEALSWCGHGRDEHLEIGRSERVVSLEHDGLGVTSHEVGAEESVERAAVAGKSEERSA